MTPKRLPRWATAGLLSLPGLAQAHGAVKGMNTFYGGLLHPLLTLPHVFLLLGLGIWLGQQRPLQLKGPMWAFALGCAAALLATAEISIPPRSEELVMALALCLGLLVASAWRAPYGLRVGVATLAAIALGLDSGVDQAPATSAMALTLLGTWISTTVLLANLAYYTALCPQRQWVHIAVRIAGSWIAAASVMVLAFFLKGMAPG